MIDPGKDHSKDRKIDYEAEIDDGYVYVKETINDKINTSIVLVKYTKITDDNIFTNT